MQNETSNNGDEKVVMLRPPRFDPSLYASDTPIHRLKSGDGGGTSGGMTEDWKVSVDNQLSQLHGDVRDLMRALIAGCVFLAVAGTGAFLLLNSSTNGIQVEQAKQGERLQSIQDTLNDTKADVKSIDDKLDLLLERKAAPTK